MTFAIDFDGTYDRDPMLWTFFVQMALTLGHDVIVVTARGDHHQPTAEHVIAQRWGPNVPVIRSYDRPKTQVAYAAGYSVDVWIDDEPWKILDPGLNLPVED